MIKNKGHNNNKHLLGFTLLEVMIALLILTVSIGSLMLTMIEMNKNQTFLKSKTIALWIAENEVNELRLGIDSASSSPSQAEKTSLMANSNWQVFYDVSPTTDNNIESIQVRVQDQNKTISYQLNATRWKKNAE